MTPVQKNKSPIGAFCVREYRGPLRPYPIKGADCTARDPIMPSPLDPHG